MEDNIIDVEIGLVIMCTSCHHRTVIDNYLLEKITNITGTIKFDEIKNQLRCFLCTRKGEAVLTKQRGTRDDYLNIVTLLRNKKISVKEFAEQMYSLKKENNPFAKKWIETSTINRQLKKEDDDKARKQDSLNQKAKWKTKQWLDWDLGISPRQGKRNRMYE